MDKELKMEFMLAAYQEGLIQTREYVFIGFHLDQDVKLVRLVDGEYMKEDIFLIQNKYR